jgi:hypothetical protein
MYARFALWLFATSVGASVLGGIQHGLRHFGRVSLALFGGVDLRTGDRRKHRLRRSRKLGFKGIEFFWQSVGA